MLNLYMMLINLSSFFGPVNSVICVLLSPYFQRLSNYNFEIAERILHEGDDQKIHHLGSRNICLSNNTTHQA